MTTAPTPATTGTGRRRRVVWTLVMFAVGWVAGGLVVGDWAERGRDLWGAFVVGLNLTVAWFIVKWGWS